MNQKPIYFTAHAEESSPAFLNKVDLRQSPLLCVLLCWSSDPSSVSQ